MLTIVIPALNEAQSIVGICRRCNEQAARIRKSTGHEIEILVVDDGSTDGTGELAHSVEGVTVISHVVNQGYGAALMTGFRCAHGELLGFLDADGTCDPSYFVPLIAAVERGASVALGNRLGPDSRMPGIRRLGNRLFATAIGLLSGAKIRDSASGMRVLRRDCLDLLLPLPAGMNFTPAMSCRAALDPRLRLAEVPMSYAEREGSSKLRLLRDGCRFAVAILEIAVTYRPMLLFGVTGSSALLVASLYGIGPVRHYVQTGGFAEDSVYRILTIFVLTTGGLALIYAGALADYAQQLVHPVRKRSALGATVRRALFARPIARAALCFGIAVAVNARALHQYATLGEIHVHWTSVAIGTLLGLAGIQLLVFGTLRYVFDLLAKRVAAVRVELLIDRPRAAASPVGAGRPPNELVGRQSS